MPVEDHPVHDKTRIGADFRYGCNSVKTTKRTFPGYFALNRIYDTDGRFEDVQKFIPHVMSKTCRSSFLWDVDPACADCKQPRTNKFEKEKKALK